MTRHNNDHKPSFMHFDTLVAMEVILTTLNRECDAYYTGDGEEKSMTMMWAARACREFVDWASEDEDRPQIRDGKALGILRLEECEHGHPTFHVELSAIHPEELVVVYAIAGKLDSKGISVQWGTVYGEGDDGHTYHCDDDIDTQGTAH